MLEQSGPGLCTRLMSAALQTAWPLAYHQGLARVALHALPGGRAHLHAGATQAEIYSCMPLSSMTNKLA